MSAPSPALFFDTVSAYQRTDALRTAIELDLFTHIGSGHQTVEQIAVACHASARGIRILADYLTIIGFLRKTGDRYELLPDTAVFLNRKSPAFVGSSIDFLLTPQIQQCFASLTTAVRQGGTAISEEGTVSYDNPIWVAFAEAMVPLMQLPAKLLVDLIGGDRQQPIRVLDVAAGHGIFGITIAQNYPHAKITALDWPNVLSVASKNATAAQVADRHSLLAGSAFEVDWGGPYDVVLLTNFLHHFDVATCAKLAEKSFQALAPDGRAVTLEFIPEPDRISPPGTATFALTMLATTAHGDAYTFAEYEQLFAKAGFARSTFHSLPPTTQQAVVSYRTH
jgi:2-polyprenyl-3-methyl-5-hydroxy-6-metoxy-1,4-benzoquinol methylase